jgi:hypothetical protein
VKTAKKEIRAQEQREAAEKIRAQLKDIISHYNSHIAPTGAVLAQFG